MNLSFQYPAWLSIFCVLLGAIYALVLYYKNKSFYEQSTRLNWIMATLRFLGVTFLSLLLLAPLLKSWITESKKPILVLAQDNSESIAAAIGSNQDAYKANWAQLKSRLGNKFEVKDYTFGVKVNENGAMTFSEKQSNLSDFMKSVYDLYSNQNLGAIVVASDGIYNEGSNPIYAASKLTAPVYTIALGDTTKKKDLLIKRLYNNKIAYLGDKFSVQIDVAATNCNGANSAISLYLIDGENVKKLESKAININKTDFFGTNEVILNAEKAGVQHYKVVLNEVSGEANKANNEKDFYVEVLDARTKILLMANAPHPDVSALKQSIESNKNYTVTVADIADAKLNYANFDFAILHQLPSKTNDAVGLLRALDERKTPRLFVLGMQSNLQKINQLQSLVTVIGDGKIANDVQAKFSPNFGIFIISEKITKDLPNFPPLISPFGDYKEGGGAQILLYQKIGKVETKYPLLAFGEVNNIKTGVLAAEGIWKWRMFDFLQHKNQDIVNEIVTKSVQFLNIKEDKRKFRISTPKTLFAENEAVTFDAELYNDNYELVNAPDVTLQVKNKEGKEFSYTFNKSGKSYNLNIGRFPQGYYSYKGTTNFNGQQLNFEGQFSVQAIQVEAFETTADFNTLRLLSQKYGGEMFAQNQFDNLATAIEAKAGKPILYSTNKTQGVINLKWIFFILLGLFASEWFLRRYHGGY